MKKIFKINSWMLVCVMMLIILSGCNNSQNEEEELKKKINTEISYIDSELVSIVNALNNINYAKYKVITQEIEGTTGSGQSQQSGGQKEQSSEERNSQESGQGSESSSKGGNSNNSKQEEESSGSSNKIYSVQANNVLGKQSDVDWSELKNRVEDLYVSWTAVSLDLKKAGVSEHELTNFARDLDMAAKAVKNEDKNETINGVVTLYSYLPKFAEVNSESSKERNLLNTKYDLLLCYKYADLENWDELEKSLNDLKMSFSNIVNKKDEFVNKDININSATVIINEMGNTSESKDKDVFFIKYKNLMQELNTVLDI